MRVIVAGAGIGGLTLAHALGRAGIEVRVLERSPHVAPVGAGITVQSNALAALHLLELDAPVIAAGCAPKTSAMLDERGRVVSEQNMGRIFTTVGIPSVALHRARLHAILLEAVGKGVIAPGVEVTSYRDLGHRIDVHAANKVIEADLLVGADGLRSRVRRQLLGDVPVRYSGYTSWRGVCEIDNLPRDRTTETWGRGRRFGVVPIGPREVYWFATANVPPGGRDGRVHMELLKRFGSWHDPIKRLIEATPPQLIVRTDITDRLPVERWSKGRVVLLGDAAHPMTPNLGQGGCQAIEDAVVLAEELKRADSLPAALQAYEHRRVARANATVRASWSLGRLAQWENIVACGFRSLLMRAVPPGMVEKQLVSALRPVVGTEIVRA